MFREFFELKGELEANGDTFSPSTLALLAYRDLMLAATGDAGPAACPLELVEQEQLRRLSSSESDDPGMAEDSEAWARQQKLQALPQWGSLPPLVQVYFRVRCLRSHADNPGPRLHALRDLLQKCPRGPGLTPVLGIIEGGASHLLQGLQEGVVLDLRHMRRAFQGVGMLLEHVTPWDRAICLTLNVSGYTCTAGCFTPASSEG